MKEHSDIPDSLRHRVFKLLDKNPILKPKEICKLLGEKYKQRAGVVTQYKKQWKREYQNQQGLIRSIPDSLHNVFYKGRLPVDFVGLVFGCLRQRRVEGWKPSRAKNKYWIFRNRLGRVRFFENGTVEMWVKKPASDGKAKGLFSQAFVFTGLIDSIKVCDGFYETLMRKAHLVFDYGQRVPYMKVTAFKESHGFVFVSGDKSHPTCAEWMLEYHSEVFQARELFESMRSFFDQFNQSVKGPKPLDRDYSS